MATTPEIIRTVLQALNLDRTTHSNGPTRDWTAQRLVSCAAVCGTKARYTRSSECDRQLASHAIHVAVIAIRLIQDHNLPLDVPAKPQTPTKGD